MKNMYPFLKREDYHFSWKSHGIRVGNLRKQSAQSFELFPFHSQSTVLFARPMTLICLADAFERGVKRDPLDWMLPSLKLS